MLLKEFCDNLDLEIVYDGGYEEVAITNSSINRPGLQLYGFYNHFDEDRVQIIGKVEDSYLRHLPPEESKEKISTFFSYSWPCLIIAWDIENGEFLEAAKKHNKILLKSKLTTMKMMMKTIQYLDDYLAPTVSIHGVLVDVFGIGVLITGSSGVGKSETALELVKRGHRLISDDVVDIKKVSDNRLLGTAPELLKQYMEIRGIGIIDVRTLYGIGAVKESVDIEMCIHLEHWEAQSYYDRLGIDNQYMNILGVDIDKVTIPVTSGRNLAIIIETGARNNRQKAMGINSAQDFLDKVNKATGNKEE
ncbi:HPr(Ser) kinase/phosphatase [Alkalibaculum bacchi]|uniref:HPr(Ser) kinase/phosphatase n=1 Tax=Alkalibaculum bacchi TaxID=645887 RepID=UPI0026F041EE|nr:HPr(Ser) kinase/phosphatase [Alkalibaculum bacchi]